MIDITIFAVHLINVGSQLGKTGIVESELRLDFSNDLIELYKSGIKIDAESLIKCIRTVQSENIFDYIPED